MEKDIIYHNETVRNWIDEQPNSVKAPFAKILETLILLDALAESPHIRQIDGDLFEMRIDRENCLSRITFLTQQNDVIIILHGYTKQTRRTLRRETALARQYMMEYSDETC